MQLQDASGVEREQKRKLFTGARRASVHTRKLCWRPARRGMPGSAPLQAQQHGRYCPSILHTSAARCIARARASNLQTLQPVWARSNSCCACCACCCACWRGREERDRARVSPEQAADRLAVLIWWSRLGQPRDAGWKPHCHPSLSPQGLLAICGWSFQTACSGAPPAPVQELGLLGAV